MLKIENIRIGNYIFYNDQPTEITKSDFLNICIDNKYIEGIALTYDWLVKFGFQRVDFDNYKSQVGRFKVEVTWYEDTWTWRLKMSSQKLEEVNMLKGYWTVHEFQNLMFSLIGKEIGKEEEDEFNELF